MGEQTLLEKIKEFIGCLGFSVFLWSKGWTEEEFIKFVRQGY